VNNGFLIAPQVNDVFSRRSGRVEWVHKVVGYSLAKNAWSVEAINDRGHVANTKGKARRVYIIRYPDGTAFPWREFGVAQDSGSAVMTRRNHYTNHTTLARRANESLTRQVTVRLRVMLKSGRRDLNPRPPEPHSGALPDCATSREPDRARNLTSAPAPVQPKKRAVLGISTISTCEKRPCRLFGLPVSAPGAPRARGHQVEARLSAFATAPDPPSPAGPRD
jgi:hypothetical protein